MARELGVLDVEAAGFGDSDDHREFPSFRIRILSDSSLMSHTDTSRRSRVVTPLFSRQYWLTNARRSLFGSAPRFPSKLVATNGERSDSDSWSNRIQRGSSL